LHTDVCSIRHVDPPPPSRRAHRRGAPQREPVRFGKLNNDVPRGTSLFALDFAPERPGFRVLVG
jgi:hypothetical protein